jgi:diguanylate cyclase (GGDEF)-like protein
MSERPARAGISRAAWTRLLGDDTFARIRTDEQLARLVVETAHRSATPFAALLAQLLGSRQVSERLAREVWTRAVAHRRHLAHALGRPVHLRVAALDMVLNQGLLPRPLLVDPDVVNALLEESRTDALTGLPNRRHFTVVLEHEIRQRHRPSVALLDVDGLKQVNDRHGHAQGDAVLRGLADVLRSACREGDVAARLGGDEFGLVFVDSDEPSARRVLRRIERAFVQAHAELGVGLSHGVVGAGERADPESLLREADRRMYALKRGHASARTEPPPVVLYATQRADRYLAIHGAFAAAGMMVVPARSAGAAVALAQLLMPPLLASDLMYPPRGGLALLEDLGRRAPARMRILVAPQRWRGVGRSMPEGVGFLAFPPTPTAVRNVVRRVAPAVKAACPVLGSRPDAEALLDSVERLVSGARAGAERVPGLDRPELDLVRSLLGA